jgi:cobalt-precorrin 5A hydrolase
VIVAGLGFSSICRAEDLVALVCRAEALTRLRASHLATLSPKAGVEALQRAAVLLKAEIAAVPAEAAQAVQPLCPTPSERAEAELGLASVAEGCALAAAGEGAWLVLPRIANARATCALVVGEG